MRVAIAGAGAVGRSIAAELVENGHEVLVIDKDSRAIDVDAPRFIEQPLVDRVIHPGHDSGDAVLRLREE